MFQAHVLSSIWDLVDLGIAESLDRIQALGADGVSVIVTSGPVAGLRCAKSAAPRVFRSRGGYFFQPADTCYAPTHIKPIVSSWLKGRNPLEQVVDACRARALDLRVRISAFGVGRIAARHPDAAGATAFGDVAPFALCPANPDVRGLLRGTIADLTQTYGVGTVELADLQYHSGVFCGAGVELGFEPGDVFRALLAICFSASSREAALEKGVDAAAAARRVQVALEETMRTGRVPADSVAALLEKADVLRDYLAGQRETLEALLSTLAPGDAANIVRVVPAGAKGRVPPVGVGPAGAEHIEKVSPAGLVEGAATEHIRPPHGPASGIELDAASLAVDQPPQLVSLLKWAVDSGVSHVVLANFGSWPAPVFEVVKQAIRYAKRAAD